MRGILFSKLSKEVTLETLFNEAIDCYLWKHCPVERAKRNVERQKKNGDIDLNLDSGPSNSVSSSISNGAANSRYIPANTKSEVILRDGYQCAYERDGKRCDCVTGLEVDHIHPYGVGGGRDAENLRLLCKKHNLMAAEEFYGREHMAQFRQQ